MIEFKPRETIFDLHPPENLSPHVVASKLWEKICYPSKAKLSERNMSHVPCALHFAIFLSHYLRQKKPENEAFSPDILENVSAKQTHAIGLNE